MVHVLALAKSAATQLLDFALPPRCAGCGVITEQLHRFCQACWAKIEWLGDGGCRTCGVPLEATDIDDCGRCLAQPPVIGRARAAVAYDDLTRTLPIRLKYSRKVALARTMATYMQRFVNEAGPDAILVPVPLHRRRLWMRGFNQSMLIARELSKQTGLAARADLIVRHRPTAPLKGMSASRRKTEVRGAFRVADRSAVEGRSLILVDDVLTTGVTAETCARTLLKAGAQRVELVCWARVVRPGQLMR